MEEMEEYDLTGRNKRAMTEPDAPRILGMDPATWRELLEWKQERDLSSAAALEQGRRLLASEIAPHVIYRCSRGCTLLKAWQYGTTVVIWQPAMRASKRRVENYPSPPLEVLSVAARDDSAPDPQWSPTKVPPLPSALRLPPRGQTWERGTSFRIFLACEHVYGTFSKAADHLARHLDAALASGSQSVVKFRAPPPDHSRSV